MDIPGSRHTKHGASTPTTHHSLAALSAGITGLSAIQSTAGHGGLHRVMEKISIRCLSFSMNLTCFARQNAGQNTEDIAALVIS